MLAGQALTMGDTLLVSLIGMCVVLLALMIIVLAKVVNRLTGQGKAVQPAAPAAPAVVDNTQEEETFAVLMSVICEDMKVPPEQLCFKEIKEIQ